ncbi:hypothetical protein [Fulvivirga lutea]|uniref:DUF4369 domain-containing protein n=1 Tax=Fulvivirga lutea TaxID=2810512 RepID=A0A974WKP9_9BACT|nr:hypothetical protein [Fulvivirga lutea]QSE97143.1 hypothetical protein JR347_16350 [Fulvivirga lutea]
MHRFLFLVFILASFSLSAQDKLFILDGDTLTGKVIIELPEMLFEDVVLKNDEGRTRYKAYEITGFTKDDELYHTVRLNNKYRIMRVEKLGYLSLYYFREDESYDFGSRYLEKLDGDGLVVPNISFKKQLTEFLSDCDGVSEAIEEKKLKKNDLDEIIDRYNACIEKNTMKRNLEVAELKNTEHPAITIINKMLPKVSAENTELKTLLKDILSKVVAEKPVPGYLISALKDQTKDLAHLSADVTALTEALN